MGLKIWWFEFLLFVILSELTVLHVMVIIYRQGSSTLYCAFCLKMPNWSPESEVPTKPKNNQTLVSSLDIHYMYVCMHVCIYDIYDMYVFLV
jgi:hypothetical protein